MSLLSKVFMVLMALCVSSGFGIALAGGVGLFALAESFPLMMILMALAIPCFVLADKFNN